MAKLICSYDTITKELSVLQDGQIMSDVGEVSFSQIGHDKEKKPLYAARVGMYSADENNDMYHTHTLYAKQLEQYKDVGAKVQEHLVKLAARDFPNPKNS